MQDHQRQPARPRWLGAVAAVGMMGAMGMMGACTTAPDSEVRRPTTALPLPPPPIDRAVTGSLFQGTERGLFARERRPRAIGDTLKVEIAESQEASSRHKTDTSRENQVATKGPGTASESSNGLLKKLINLNATASGSDSFKGSGASENKTNFTGRIAVTVINVLANGNLVVAGERRLSLDSGSTTLRFSGIVDPTDIRAGNVVASADVVDVRLETEGGGELGEGARRGWLQRILTDSLRVW